MLTKNRIPTHPGEILLEEFLVPRTFRKLRLRRILVCLRNVSMKLYAVSVELLPKLPGCLRRLSALPPSFG